MSTEELPLILQLDQAGNPMTWCDYQASAYYYAKDLIAWEAAPVNFTLHGGINARTGKQSTLTINTIIALKGKMSGKQLAASLRVPLSNRTLFRRDHNMCAYCGNIFNVHDLTRDHIVPASRGGANNWMNVVTACSGCNKHKDDRTPDEAGMKLLFVPYVPSKGEFLILQNRKILADQMKFLLARVSPESRLLVA